jgi:two-component system phosphate regulon sensor histidine kinase PhoR
VAPEIVVFVALMVVIATGAVAAAITRQNALDRASEALGGGRTDLERAIRASLDRAADAEFRANQHADDLTQLADLLGVGVIRVDDAMRVQLANHAAHVFLGRSPGSLAGLSAIEAFVDARIEAVVADARSTGGATAELTLRESNERVVQVRARRSAVDGVWVVMEDLTELRRLQRIRAEFIDNLSHELRTPLTTVRLLTETVARDLEHADLPPRARDMIQKIDVETGHLVQMVNELLDLSKIETGSTQLHLDSVDVATVVTGSVERIALFAERQGVVLRAELPPDGDRPRVRGDVERLGQLLINLLHNAIKFSEEGDKVTVRVTGARDTVVIAVADEGVGIPRGDIERIFERFYKVDKARVRGKGGTGLGLAIARHIAEGHGGRLAVESEEGRGATFTVTLPRERPE